MECNENWLWYMLNGEFVRKWMGNKGFNFCEKWFIIFHIQFSEPMHTSQANRIHWISFPIYQFLLFILWHWIGKKISSAQQQFNFTVDDLYFVPWLARNWTNLKYSMSKGDSIKRVLVSWEEKKKSRKSQQFFTFFFSNPCSTSISNQKVCRFNAVKMKLS